MYLNFVRLRTHFIVIGIVKVMTRKTDLNVITGLIHNAKIFKIRTIRNSISNKIFF